MTLQGQTSWVLVNLVAPFLGGIPVCHGCGGLAGHYTFGARTGGSVILYGGFLLAAGAFFGGPLQELLKAFPMPVLGVVLFFESLALLSFIRDVSHSARETAIALLTGVIAFAVPQGFLAGLLAGTIVHYGFRRFGQEVRAEGEEASPGREDSLAREPLAEREPEGGR